MIFKKIMWTAQGTIEKSSRNASGGRHFESKYHQDKSTYSNEPAKNKIDKGIGTT
jgi:hypothetical protein